MHRSRDVVQAEKLKDRAGQIDLVKQAVGVSLSLSLRALGLGNEQ